jgi:hypothetical protein
MTTLKPKAGFKWAKLTWGRPDSPRSALCSYCSAAIGENDIPLILWDSRSYAAQFCVACQKTWWGMKGFEDEGE